MALDTDSPVGIEGVVRVAAPSDFEALKADNCPAVVLDRSLPDGLQAWLEGLDPAVLPSARVILQPKDIASTLNAICDDAGLPASPYRDALESDITDMAKQFCAMMDAKHLRLRLDVVTTNACRKFHIDTLTARLVCTYRGTGTQFGVTYDDFDPDVIETVTTGNPILLRGTLWPADLDGRFLHRSPPIQGTGETRLLLVIDPIDDPETAM